MKIKVNLRIFLFVLIFLLTRQIEIYAFIMLFAFIHELAHLFAGIALKMKPKILEISPYGFSISFEDNYSSINKKIKRSNMYSIKRIGVASAGPIINFLIASLAYLYFFITNEVSIIGIKVDMIIYSNLLIFIFNSLPIYQLDGGRILKELISIFGGLRKSYRAINLISNITLIIITGVASIAVLIYKNIAIVIIIIYLWIITIRENMIYEKKKKILNIAYCKK